jgi:hypothetical protein
MFSAAYLEFRTFEQVVYQTEHKISETGSVFVLMWNDLEGPNQFYLKQTDLIDE